MLTGREMGRLPRQRYRTPGTDEQGQTRFQGFSALLLLIRYWIYSVDIYTLNYVSGAAEHVISGVCVCVCVCVISGVSVSVCVACDQWCECVCVCLCV